LTDHEGRYVLSGVQPGAYTVTARRIGFVKKSAAITVEDGQDATADFALAAAAATLGEVVVTAQKRNERNQDVPVPVTALAADNLVDNNKLRLQDYYGEVPGLNMTLNYNGAPTVTVRGLSTGSGTNPTTGIIVDGVPFGSSTALGGGFYAPDIDPSDLARVEVLRGPQGTLYGANSIGGLLNFVTVDPSTDRLSGRVQAGSSGVLNGADAGYNVHGSVNVPVNEEWAVRASGFARRDPGYVNDPVLSLDGVNRTNVDGGRLSSLWKPSADVSVGVSGLLQSFRADGSSDVHVGSGLGDLEQSVPFGVGRRYTKLESVNGTLGARLGTAQLTSVTGYTVNSDTGSTDLTPFFSGFADSLYGVSGAALLDDIQTNKFSQELRLAAPIGRRTDAFVGAFYTHEKSQYTQAPWALDFNTGAQAGLLDSVSTATTYAEFALFGDLTFRLTERFNVQVGGRQSWNKQHYAVVWDGPLVPVFFGTSSPLVPPVVDTKDNALTYLITPRYQVSPDVMVYARLASGYRTGGPNNNSTLNELPTFAPDKTHNYEIGAKGDLLHHAVSFDASLYYIDWNDLQIQVVDPVSQVGVYANASEAKSQGAEFSAEARPFQGTTIGGSVAWNDAVLTEDFPSTSVGGGESGDRLPYSTRSSWSLALDQEFPLGSSMRGSLGATLSYVGDRTGNFQCCSTPRQDFPSYTKTDARGSVTFGNWAVNLFMTNLTDERGILTGGVDNVNPIAFNYIQPRTFGMSVARSF
jgi:iron complex outermembrane receptor protein